MRCLKSKWVEVHGCLREEPNLDLVSKRISKFGFVAPIKEIPVGNELSAKRLFDSVASHTKVRMLITTPL